MLSKYGKKNQNFMKKKAQKVDFRIFMDPFWGFTLKTVLGIHDYSLEPKITKCREILYMGRLDGIWEILKTRDHGIFWYCYFSNSYFRYWTMDRSLQRRLQKTNYQHIKRLCRDRGQLFEDPDFTPTNRSIYRNKKPSLHPIVWLRPHVS